MPEPLHKTKAPACLMAALLLAAVASAQEVTVSQTGPADETSIRAAILSLAPGGGRDDGNRNNNVVRVLDSSTYTEALTIDDMGLTLRGEATPRPKILVDATAAVVTGGSAIRIDTDNEVVIEGFVILPDAASPPEDAITADEFTDTTGAPGYRVRLIDVLVSANDGSDSPVSTDGSVPPSPGAVPFSIAALDFNSTPNGSSSEVTLRDVVVTAASASGIPMVRFFVDQAAVSIEEGCRFTYSNHDAVFFSAANNTTAEWLGTASNPIVIHGNQGAAIRSNAASTRSVSRMEYVAITRNSLGQNMAAVSDIHNGGTANQWSNVVIAGNSTRETSNPADGPLSLASPLVITDSILAGDTVATPVRGTNLIRLSGPFVALTADGVCIDMSDGSTSLNTMWEAANTDPVDGVVGTSVTAVGMGVTNESPDFVSLDYGDPYYLAVANPMFAESNSEGGPLVGPGRIEPFAHSPIREQNGNLQTYLNSVYIPTAASSDKFRQPTADELMIFRSAIDQIVACQYQAAANRFGAINYDLVVFRDSVTADVFVLLEERATNRGYGGVYVVDLSPERMLVVESPHPLFDGTRLQAIDIFMRTDALAFSQSGTHRNNSDELSPCDGTQTSGDPYRLSDMAHNDLSYFQAFHEQLHRRHTSTLSLNVHGMADTSDPSDVVISNGTTADVVGQSLSKDIANRMNEILTAASDPRYAVSHQQPGENPALSGSTNTQGRSTNGSHNPCNVSASALFPERFIHMEQDPDVRGPSANWDFVVQTYNELVGLFPPVTPAPPEDGTEVGLYRLDSDATSATASPDGTLGATVTPGPDRFGSNGMALQFDGGSAVEIPDFPYTGEDFEFSVTFWFRAPASTNEFQYLFSHGPLSATGGVLLPNTLRIYVSGATNEPRVRFTAGDGASWSFNSGLSTTPDTWYFFALTYSQNDGVTAWLNASPIGTNTGIRRVCFEPEGSIIAGGRSDLDPARNLGGGASNPGAMDDLRIWNAALDLTALQALLNEPPPTRVGDYWILE